MICLFWYWWFCKDLPAVVLMLIAKISGNQMYKCTKRSAGAHNRSGNYKHLFTISDALLLNYRRLAAGWAVKLGPWRENSSTLPGYECRMWCFCASLFYYFVMISHRSYHNNSGLCHDYMIVYYGEDWICTMCKQFCFVLWF